MKKIYEYSNQDCKSLANKTGDALQIQNFVRKANELYTLYSLSLSRYKEDSVLGMRFNPEGMMLPSTTNSNAYSVIISESALISWKVEFVEKFGNLRMFNAGTDSCGRAIDVKQWAVYGSTSSAYSRYNKWKALEDRARQELNELYNN